ncbi:MAG TPA: DMT family transporter [Chryseolinea sp.]|nr:DMT family transporter [Chryseolinea sp.]HPH46718.1 DMT family transporter [Chryseolinea sp.]HPM29379.1 DMT family transporter [Chryseolinea sp.]
MNKPVGATPIILLITLSLIWGTSFILIKQGLKVFSPGEVGALRISAATLFLLPFALLRLKELKTRDYLNLFVSGMMGIFIPAFLFAWAQTKLESSVTGILNTLSPVWTMIIGALFFTQRFKGFALAGIIISFIGAIILALSRSSATLSGFNVYALLVVLACAFYGANLNWLKFKVSNISSITVTSVALLLTGPFAIIYLFRYTEFTVKLTETPGAWKAFAFIAVLALMSTAIANLIFTKLVKISTPLFASSVTYIMPIVAVMWGVLDGEQLFIGHFIGMIAILLGVYLANKK